MLAYEALRTFENDLRNAKLVLNKKLGFYKSCLIPGVDEPVRTEFKAMSLDGKMHVRRTGCELARRHAEIAGLHHSVRMYADAVLQARKFSVFHKMFQAVVPEDILTLIAEHVTLLPYRSDSSQKWATLLRALTAQHAARKLAELSAGCYFEAKFRELLACAVVQ